MWKKLTDAIEALKAVVEADNKISKEMLDTLKLILVEAQAARKNMDMLIKFLIDPPTGIVVEHEPPVPK